MGENNISMNQISFANATQIIDFEEDPVLAVRVKKDSSMVVGLRMLGQNQGDAFVSAGSTGALLTGSTLLVKRIKGIKRAALAPVLPTARGVSMLVDAGANVDSTPEYLLQFAVMGSAYMETVLGVANPSVGLINIGTEESKGTALQKDAFALLQKSSLNFYGNIEGRNIAEGTVDVIVCDGFTGNVVLKTFEGLGLYFYSLMKELFMASIKTKLAALLVKSGLKSFKKKMNYKETGGAMFLGINAAVIKAHGSSDEEGFFGAIRQAYHCVNGDIVGKIKQKLAENDQVSLDE
jgi:glycerol-3-phosphate acyltransferase PlsX